MDEQTYNPKSKRNQRRKQKRIRDRRDSEKRFHNVKTKTERVNSTNLTRLVVSGLLEELEEGME